MHSVNYGDKEIKIVESGMTDINKVLESNDYSAKESLLLCLDKYLDPWFGYHLPYENEIFSLLEKELCRNNPITVKEDIIQLLGDYCRQPLEYLKNHMEQMEPELLPDIKYILSQR